MLHIVLVEDNPADAEMLETVLQQTGAPVDIVRLDDGFKAIEYLTLNNVARQYDLVLLDLNLPGLSGFEVLERIRAHEELKSLPVVVMSGSSDPADIERCYRDGANSYVCKSSHLEEIFFTVAQLVAYWSTVVKLPPRRRIASVSGVRAECP
jgi:CheY-like chemotaxis protein